MSHLSEEAGLEAACFNPQVLPTDQYMAREQGRKVSQEIKLLGALRTTACSALPSSSRPYASWIMVCCTLHPSHINSCYIFVTLSRVAEEYLSWL